MWNRADLLLIYSTFNFIAFYTTYTAEPSPD